MKFSFLGKHLEAGQREMHLGKGKTVIDLPKLRKWESEELQAAEQLVPD